MEELPESSSSDGAPNSLETGAIWTSHWSFSGTTG
jgi:hypothetical protein